MPGDSERSLWRNVPSGLERRVLNSEEELKLLFPETEDFEDVRLITEKDVNYKEGIRRYGRINKKNFGTIEIVAYGCIYCGKIIIGPPRIVDDTSINNNTFLSGSEGFRVYCHNCSGPLYSETFRWS
jgi:hypothetical protein